jgi:hypothetical protein
MWILCGSRLLLKERADFLVKDREGWTPLDVAVEEDEAECAQMLRVRIIVVIIVHGYQQQHQQHHRRRLFRMSIMIMMV